MKFMATADAQAIWVGELASLVPMPRSILPFILMM